MLLTGIQAGFVLPLNDSRQEEINESDIRRMKEEKKEKKKVTQFYTPVEVAPGFTSSQK